MPYPRSTEELRAIGENIENDKDMIFLGGFTFAVSLVPFAYLGMRAVCGVDVQESFRVANEYLGHSGHNLEKIDAGMISSGIIGAGAGVVGAVVGGLSLLVDKLRLRKAERKPEFLAEGI